MAEKVSLTTSVVKTQTQWDLVAFHIDVLRRLIRIELLGDNGEQMQVLYPTPPPIGSSQPSGQTLLSALNTANLTSNSLVKRVYNQLISDGHITGTVSGSPL